MTETHPQSRPLGCARVQHLRADAPRAAWAAERRRMQQPERLQREGNRRNARQPAAAFRRGRCRTCALGVPTVWIGLLQHLDATGKRLDSVKRVTWGGSAVPVSMIRTFAERYGVELIHGWGMTEMSPVGSVSIPKPKQITDGPEAEYAIRARQGRPLYGVEFKIVDADGKRLPEDGIARGELLVRGPWVAGAYYRDDDASQAALDTEGWFRTGDVATIDA